MSCIIFEKKHIKFNLSVSLGPQEQILNLPPSHIKNLVGIVDKFRI